MLFWKCQNLLESCRFTGGPSSSCETIILRNNGHGGIIRVCIGIFTSALRNKKIRQILKKNTSPRFHSVLLVIWPLTLMKRAHLSELFISRFSTYIRKAFLMYVENLEMNNSLKWALFIKVSGQITSNTLWKRGEVFFLRIWRIFLFLRALVNIPIQTLIIPPWPLLRKMIVSQLELGPPVFRRGEFDGIW